MRIGTGVTYIVFAAALGAAGFAAGQAPAQPANPCLALPTDAERLVCMRDSRAAAEAAQSADAALAARAAAEAQVQTQTQVQTPARAPAPAAGQSAADRCFALPTDAERLSCMRDALAIAEAALAAGRAGEGDDGFLGLGIFGGRGGDRPNALVASESEFAAGLGAEQLAGYSAPQQEEDVRVQAAIVSVSEWEPGVPEFELDNGQVWRQLGGDTQRVRLGRGPHPVELFGSWAGGYRMTIPSQRQTIQVRRIR